MIKRFFLARSTVLTLIILVLGAVVVGYLFPQRFLLSPAGMDRWALDHPFLATLSRTLALDHVYTSPWFAVLLALFMVSLLFSTWEQFTRALRLTREGGAAAKAWSLPALRKRLPPLPAGWAISGSAPMAIRSAS